MVSVAAITALALVGVAVLAVQANGSAPKTPKATVVVPHPSTTNSAGQPVAPAPDPLALPAGDTGSGKRIVYSLKGSRIWLVTTGSQVQQTAQVVPCNIPLVKGKYAVSKWRNTSKGSDETSVQYVVYWGNSSTGFSNYGFDAVASVQGMPPAPTKPTGGVRMSQADALAVWTFATAQSGTPVIVVD
jgi:methionine-rich copper-binding protein CopC